MKLCVLKIGGRIAIDSRSTSGGTGEALSVIKILTEGGHDVTVFTKVLNKDIMSKEFNIKNIEDEYLKINDYGFDALLIINGNVNYFGGQDSPSDTLIYYCINNFKNKVFYILCDPALTLKQIWPSVEKKKWSNNYKKEDIEIVRQDITYICQAKDTKELSKIIEKNCIIVNSIYHFPFEKFVYLMLNENAAVKDYKYDLIYGGTFRSGRREKSMVKFYCDYPEDIKVLMFGKIEQKNFNEKYNIAKYPEFGKSVSYFEFNNKMREGLSTIIIGDPLYIKLDNMAQRVHEAILNGNIVFIDLEYDKHKKVFNNDEILGKFSYITNKEDVIKRIQKLKENPKLIDYFVNRQREVVNFNKNEYCNILTEILEGKEQ